mgnify:CR=1 FL=1
MYEQLSVRPAPALVPFSVRRYGHDAEQPRQHGGAARLRHHRAYGAHVVCLFETVEDALAFDKYVCAHVPKVPNRPEIFGEQWVLNENDEKIGEISELLITATDISINDVQALVKEFNGVAFPAHVDKDAYSVTASLGAIPPEAQFSAAELSLTADAAQQRLLHPELESMVLLRSSDAHYLHLMPEEHQTVELPEKTAKALLDVLRGFGAGKFQAL